MVSFKITHGRAEDNMVFLYTVFQADSNDINFNRFYP